MITSTPIMVMLMDTAMTISTTTVITIITAMSTLRCGATRTVPSRRNWQGRGWQRGLSAIVAVGLRPCSGAILVLVFALAQGMLWAGVAATFVMGLGTAITVAAIATLAVGARELAQKFAGSQSGYGMLALRGIETGAAFVILAFGSLLLFGYLFSERLPLC